MTEEKPAAAPRPPRPGRAGRWFGALAVAAGVLILASVSGGWWAVRSEGGSAWLLSVLPGVQVEKPRGKLFGDFEARRFVFHLPGGSSTLSIDRLAWRGLVVERAASPLWVRIGLESLSADRVDLALAPSSSGTPMKAPTDLQLPVELDLHSLRIGELHLAALGAQPIRDLSAQVHLGAEGGNLHRIDHLALGWGGLQLRGDARIAARGPLALTAGLGIAQAAVGALPSWSASVALNGPLASPTLLATLSAEPSADRPAQSLDARATLHPFAAWPLGGLTASAKGLDLSAFAAAAPATAIDLDATATSTAPDQPASVAIRLTNARPGPWDESRLPLRGLTVVIAARPDRPNQIEWHQVDADLGTERASAGHLRGDGNWSPTGWNLAATLDSVQPGLLDARAPAMTLSGPITAKGDTAVDLVANLDGALVDRGARRPVQLKLAAGLQPQRIEVREFQASAGEARASLSGLFTRRDADAPWVAKAQAALVDFDPATWWPGDATAPWHKAETRLNAKATLDMSVPVKSPAPPLLEMLAAWRGQAAVTIGPSVLVGAPLTGEAHWRSAGGTPAAVSLTLDASGNTVQAQGRLNFAGNGSSDDWTVAIDAKALAKLAPVYRLFQPAGSAATLAGTLNAKAHLTGRWPALSTQGQLDANALQLGSLAVQKAQARWTLGTSASAPVEATATLTHLGVSSGGVPGPSLETLQLQLSGTGRAHTLELHAATQGQPPAWTDTVQGGGPPQAAARTVAVLQARGGIIDLPNETLAGWRGTIGQVDLRSDSPGSAPLFHTQNVGAEVLWGGGTPHADLQPGRADLLGGAIRWSRLSWQAAASGGFAQIEVDADLEPLRIAPLLARAQPDFGWGGDLAIAGHVKLRSAPTFSADVVIERRGGDLTVTDDLGTRSLGLTDLRLGLSADQGTWSFTQGLAGKTLGVVAGAEVIRTSAQAVWPTADAPLQGVLELRVDDLGTWGSWVPPGWRLGGGLHTSASFGGRFGAPEYTGLIEGTKLAVRNYLQGVNVTDGDVAIRLQGTTARIERFVAHAGDGTVSLQGNAELGASPRAALQLVADKFQLLGRVDRRIVASGSGQLRIDSKTLAFDGKFGVDEGLIDFTRSDAPSLSDDVVVKRAKDVPSPAAAASAAAKPDASALPSATPSRQVALDLAVDLGRNLAIRGRGLDAKLRGDLRVTSPGGVLAVNGTVRAEDGTYAAYGQKLRIDRGLIVFTGNVDNPRLDIEATRPDIDTRVGVIISGTPTNLRIRLFSEPEMSEIDKLSWLVMGHASDAAGGTDTALLQRAALALLAGEGGGPTDQITKALGLDDISLKQQTDGDVTQTVLALGKQISKRWYVGYERGLNATTGSFELIYRLAQRLTVRMQTGDDTSVDLIWTWRWK